MFASLVSLGALSACDKPPDTEPNILAETTHPQTCEKVYFEFAPGRAELTDVHRSKFTTELQDAVRKCGSNEFWIDIWTASAHSPIDRQRVDAIRRELNVFLDAESEPVMYEPISSSDANDGKGVMTIFDRAPQQ
ncbi:MAG: hypothetical protein RLN72_03850 [Henriciella sp.]